MEAARWNLTNEQARRNRWAILALFFVIVGSVGLDQLTKVHAQNTLMVWSHETDPALYRGMRYPIAAIGDEPGGGQYISLNINYVRNEGAAWGFMANMNDTYRVPFFFAITIVAVMFLFYYFRMTPPEHRIVRYGLALVLSGAIGNFIDRVRLGYVIDWIDVHWDLLGWRYFFPNFNVADSAICIGVFLLLYDMIVFDVMRRKQSTVAGSNPSAG